MNRNDYNLIAAVLRSAIDEGKAQPILALRMTEAFVQRGDREPDFLPQDFINRCVRETKRSELPKITAKKAREHPHPKPREVVKIEDDAAMFSAILAVEFPHLKDRVFCALTLKQSERFTIGRAGVRVWIRFGEQAMADPVSAVRDAVEGAQEMLRGTTIATQIKGR